MIFFKAALAAFVLIQTLSFASAVSAAGDTCRCWCGVEGSGARVLDGSYASSRDCKERCEQESQEYVVCATNTATPSTSAEASTADPIFNSLCWTEDECLAGKVDNSDKPPEWGAEQPAECLPTYHYCYSPVISVPLNVNIGPLKTTLPLGEYINVLYTYGLGAAAIIVVVMIMIGGVQYILGSSSGSEMVSKGKERIKNAVIGLVLLLFAYLVLATVNPALVEFKTLRLPRPKPSLFITAGCEDMAKAKYDIEPQVSGKVACGDTGHVSKDPSGGVLTETTCIYESCELDNDDGSLCVKVKDKYQCLTCEDASDGDTIAAGFDPSPSHCASLNPASSDGSRDRCVFVETTGIVSSLAGSEDFCAEILIDCSGITECSGYDDAVDNTFVYYFTDLATSTTSGIFEQIHSITESVCNDNPCRDTIGTACSYNAAEDTCVGP